ncbi:chorismate-binding protein [Fundidesulfovibrio putealis]|uniref:chorismate-binding protein n=1 Tax=Fundidesulfovibrio putealis TaxID=270496 RepID=UPI0004095C89|nr:chorismate-binding protein [Fundidesulfovibrio putealis]
MTRSTCCCPAEGLSWLGALAPEEPDVFLTPTMPGIPASGVVGLWPRLEWRLGPNGDSDGGRQELSRFCDPAHTGPGPALGYLNYEAGFEALGLSAPQSPPEFPPGVFRKYRAVLAPSPDARHVFIHADSHQLAREAALLVQSAPRSASIPLFDGPLRASLDADGYRRAVSRALEHILDGDAYQLNLSIRFDTDWPAGLSPASLFTHLLRERPAMFYALFQLGGQAIVSTSPERFIRVQDGRVLSQPIKGTRPAVPGAVRDLLASPKEDAELSMIVDLIRNDISPHCRYGSVRVEGHKSLFEVDGLLQMYANVTGELRPGSTALDLLWDALPPGSVTGCPKRRAAEIIADLEPHRREVYCGCMVMAHGPRDLDSSVAIRTALADPARNLFSFFAGSGIVVESDPDSEYRETLAKAEKFLELTRRNQP